METVRPIFKKALLVAIVVYVAGTALLLSDLYTRIGSLEYDMEHVTGKCKAKHQK